MLKAMVIGAVLSACVATVIGSQGSSGGVLGIDSMMVADTKLYWSWPLFFAGSGFFWGLILLQK